MENNLPLQYTSNKTELLEKRSSLLNLSSKPFKYQEQDAVQPPPASDPSTQHETWLQTLNELLINTHSPKTSVNSRISNTRTVISLCFLALAFFIGSGFFGPGFLMISSEILALKAFWRQLLLTVLLIIPAIAEKAWFSSNFSWKKLKGSVLAGVLQGFWLVSFSHAVHNTAISHVYVLNGLDLLALTLIKPLTKKRLAGLEICGAVALIFVAGLVFYDRNLGVLRETGQELSTWQTVFQGDCVALCGGVVFAVFFTVSEYYEIDCPYWLCNWVVNAVSLLILLIFCWGLGAQWTMQTNDGLFAVFTAKLFVTNVILAIVAGVFYQSLLGIIKKYYEVWIFRGLLSISAVSASFFSYLWGIEELPSAFIWIAIVLSIAAGILISFGKRSSEGFEFELNKKDLSDESKSNESIEMINRY